MDNNIVDALWWLVPLIIVIKIKKSRGFKGFFGELIVNLSAKLFLNNKEYHLIANVTLPTEHGSTQIDHIIVSRYGVFVIETKNIKGWILGNEHQETWTQRLFKHKNLIRNPLRQNQNHIKVLGRVLGLSPDSMFSIVAFVGDSKFKSKMPENVTSGNGFIRFIKSKKEYVFSEDEVNKITSKIEKARIPPSFKTSRNHVKYVKSVVARKNKRRL